MKNKKGISLIVLVITIIVMIVLAGAIILTLNNSGIINKANEAVDKTNMAQIKQIAELAWAEAYMDLEDKTDTVALKNAVKNALTANGLNPDDYGMIVTTNGVTIQKGWLKDGFTIVRGDRVLKIGDSIAYDAGVSTYTAGWKVLGADNNGNLLIVSAENVRDNFQLGKNGDLATSQDDYKTGVAQLNAECEPYGYGKGVIGIARSITAKDVNEVTGYDPTKYNFNGTSGESFGEGQINQYGNEVTYEWDTTDENNIKLTYKGTLNAKTGSISYRANAFMWYDEKTGTFLSVATGDTTIELPTLKSTFYTYEADKLITISATENSKAYSMLFGQYHYWLATPYVSTWGECVGFGLLDVSGEGVSYYDDLFNSSGITYFANAGIRAVVTLSSDINLTGSSEGGWSY